jgi:glutathione S-transferase
MNDNKRILWGFGTPRPLWALAELGLTYEHKKILPRGAEMDDPDFRALNERHKIPFYQDDRVQMGESAAIVLYLADRHCGDVLPMPAPVTRERAILLDHTMFIMTEIDSRLYTVRLHGEPPAGLSSIYGAAPAAVKAARQYVENSLHESARWFEDGRQCVMGEHFGTADILLVSCLDWALMYGMELPSPLGAYRDRIAQRPGYLAAMAENDPSNTVAGDS